MGRSESESGLAGSRALPAMDAEATPIHGVRINRYAHATRLTDGAWGPDTPEDDSKRHRYTDGAQRNGIKAQVDRMHTTCRGVVEYASDRASVKAEPSRASHYMRHRL